MSSFRIDRQYVSFVTAETQPVHATVQPVNRKTAAASPDPGGLAGDIGKLYEEIYKRLQSENADQAEYILEQARAKAQTMTSEAKEQADDMIKKAEADAEAIREDAKNKGYLEGLEQAGAAEEERKIEEAAALKRLENQLKDEYSALVGGVDKDVIVLVMEIVKKIIGIKLSQSDDIFLGLVSDALERLKQAGSVTIRVSSEDYTRYFGNGGPGVDAGDMKVTVVEDEGFKCGDLIVESEGEVLDLSITRQISQVENAFLSGEGN
jgi:flagellar assembly protein FliH